MLTMSRQAPWLGIVVIAILATGCVAASQRSNGPSTPSSPSPVVDDSAVPDRGTPLAWVIAPSGDGSAAGVLVLTAPEGGDAYAAHWVPDVAMPGASGPFTVHSPVRAARADAEAAPRILERNGASFTLHTLTEGQLADTETFAVDLKPGETVDDRFFWLVGPDGDEALVYSLHASDDRQRGAFARVRAAEGAWRTVALDADRTVVDVDASGGRIELLLVGTDGTYHATASYDGAASMPMLVLPPSLGWGIDVATDASGRVVVLAGEPDYDTLAPVPGSGALVATKAAQGWDIQQTGIPYRGSYAHLRSGPSTRVILPDPDAKAGNWFGVFAPSEGAWRKVASHEGFSVNPRFVPGTPFVLVAAAPGETGSWFAAHAVP